MNSFLLVNGSMVDFLIDNWFNNWFFGNRNSFNFFCQEVVFEVLQKSNCKVIFFFSQ